MGNAAVALAVAIAVTFAMGATTILESTRRVQADPAGSLAVIVHQSNPVDNLTFTELRRIVLLETQTWPHGRKITLVLREKGQPERAEVIKLIGGMSEAEYDRHVLFQTFRGDVGWGPRSIRSADAMLRFIFNAPGAIGYVRGNEVDASIKVLRIDGFTVGDPRYPLRPRPRTPDLALPMPWEKNRP